MQNDRDTKANQSLTKSWEDENDFIPDFREVLHTLPHLT